jgi:hypothetical protein
MWLIIDHKKLFEYGCKTKIDCWWASEWVTAGTVSPLLLWKWRPHIKIRKNLKKKKKIIVRVPRGPKTKNDCAGQGQQQFTEVNCKTGDEERWGGYASDLHAEGALFDSRHGYRLSCMGFLCPYSKCFGSTLKLGKDQLGRHPFQFIIHHYSVSTNHSILFTSTFRTARFLDFAHHLVF